MTQTATRHEMIHGFLVRIRFWLLGAFILHCILIHYFFLGFVTWDGLTYRLPPVVEVAKHGWPNLWKFHVWALDGFRPFVELIHAPFLWLFGQTGLLFAWPLTLLPLCALAIHRFVRELTTSDRAAFYTVVIYICTPLVNAQVFSGYVDWSIPGLLSFFLYSLLVLAREGASPSRMKYVGFAASTFFFSMARQQAPYLAIVFFVVLGSMLFVERTNTRFTLKNKSVAIRAAVALVLGLTPVFVFQALAFARHGTPIYPYRFELFGLSMGDGMSMRELFKFGGLTEYSACGFWKATSAAYFFPNSWPSVFYDGRYFGDSIFVLTALLSLPLTIPKMNRRVRVLLVTFLLLSFAVKDFWQPRYAYGIILGNCICNGIAIAALLERPRRSGAYVACVTILVLHALRPEWEAWRLKEGVYYSRMNVTGSKSHIDGPGEVPMFPDLHANIVIANTPGNAFFLPLYGRKLTNSIALSVSPDQIGPRCEGVHAYTDKLTNALVVDDENLTKNCSRTCVIDGGWRCMAFRMDPEPTATHQ